jgi:hypothetical protein
MAWFFKCCVGLCGPNEAAGSMAGSCGISNDRFFLVCLLARTPPKSRDLPQHFDWRSVSEDGTRSTIWANPVRFFLMSEHATAPGLEQRPSSSRYGATAFELHAAGSRAIVLRHRHRYFQYRIDVVSENSCLATP